MLHDRKSEIIAKLVLQFCENKMFPEHVIQSISIRLWTQIYDIVLSKTIVDFLIWMS